MKSDILTLQTLFQKDVRYLIPSFQRPYVWEQDDQWEPLWEDVRNTAERYLEELHSSDAENDASAVERTPAHFLGAVVLQQEPFGASEIERRRVIDGQQRLTTLQLLLDAAQEVCEDLHLGPSRRLSKFVLNDRDMLGDEQDHIFKVWPTLTDRDAFRHAMHNDLPSDEYEDSRIVQAHDFFKLQVREWVEGESAPQEDLALALEAAIARLLQLVVIDLDMRDDPHVIFETLNARGTPLLQSDLIKNFMLSEAGQASEHPTARFREVEREPWQDEWWREEVRQGRLIRPRVDVFLHYWLTMRRAAEVQANDVFSDFRRYAHEGSNPIARIAADIGKVAEVYRIIETRDDNSALGRFLYRGRVMQWGAITPALLWLLTSGVPVRALERCLKAIESFLIRRMICRMTSKDYNSLTLSLLAKLEEGGATRADDVLIDFLADQTADARLWPSNNDLQEACTHLPLYRLLSRGRLRLVLEGIEERLRTPKAEETQVQRNLTIEHVMPQEWRAHWPPPLNGLEPEEAEAQRDRLVHSIGNLTFVNQRLNSALSNAPWPEKSVELAKHSTLFLNKDLLESAGDAWDEAAVEARARRLAEVAAEVWPHADRI